MERIAFDFHWWKDWSVFYLLPSISLHNFENQFCIWVQFLGLWFEIIFIKIDKRWED